MYAEILRLMYKGLCVILYESGNVRTFYLGKIEEPSRV